MLPPHSNLGRLCWGAPGRLDITCLTQPLNSIIGTASSWTWHCWLFCLLACNPCLVMLVLTIIQSEMGTDSVNNKLDLLYWLNENARMAII